MASSFTDRNKGNYRPDPNHHTEHRKCSPQFMESQAFDAYANNSDK
ncbi:MAG: hypothetical protein MKZ76_00380 [Pedosphaera sp.]|nr:hypothetical protein [Pedosphaera sp.]